jgi:uncharacterized protein (TIGR00730 family)
MSPSIHTICVYCGSADGLSQVYLDAATNIGRFLARSGIRLVYGAGKTGMMGAVADGALEAGGEVIGITPASLNTPVLIHANLTQLEVVSDMHARKARMYTLADAFIALPGGYGTFEELFETLTWMQIGLHRKPIGLLNTSAYFDILLKMVDHASQEGFILPEHRLLLVFDADPGALLEKLRSYRLPSTLDRWVNRWKKPK